MKLFLQAQHPRFDETPELCVVAHFDDQTFRRITIFFKEGEFRLVSEVAQDTTDVIMWDRDYHFHPTPARGETLDESGLMAHAPDVVKEMVRQGTQMKIELVQEVGSAIMRRPGSHRPR